FSYRPGRFRFDRRGPGWIHGLHVRARVAFPSQLSPGEDSRRRRAPASRHCRNLELRAARFAIVDAACLGDPASIREVSRYATFDVPEARVAICRGGGRGGRRARDFWWVGLVVSLRDLRCGYDR